MENEIHVENINNHQDYEFIADLMYNEPGISSTFHNREDRLKASTNCIIYKDNEKIGFFNLVTECVNNILFLDVGIKTEYRNNNYIKDAWNNFINRYKSDTFIIAEIKDNNIQSIKSIDEIGTLVYKINDKQFYLLDKNRKNEFLKSDTYKDLITYIKMINSKSKKK